MARRLEHSLRSATVTALAAAGPAALGPLGSVTPIAPRLAMGLDA